MNGGTDFPLSFAEFEVDVPHRRLLRHGQNIPLNQRAFEVLIFLIENQGRVVPKEEIMEAVWPGQFVEDSNLAVQISAIRKALDDHGSAARFILTVPRRGYQFIADAELIRESVPAEDEKFEMSASASSGISIATVQNEFNVPAGANGADRTEYVIDRRRPPAVTEWLKRLRRFIGFDPPTPNKGAIGRFKSLAVLPFKPLVSGDHDESLELGLADALIFRFSKLRGLTVRPISSVRRYASPGDDAARVGRELDVEIVMDGQIQKCGGYVRVTVWLLRVSDGFVLWSGKFDEKFVSNFSLYDSVCERIIRSISMTSAFPVTGPHFSGQFRIDPDC